MSNEIEVNVSAASHAEAAAKAIAVIDIVKEGNLAHFSYYRSGYLYYNVTAGDQVYQFPVDTVDLGGASVEAEIKAITLMRYIRKALADGTFVKVA